jgi:hypothetical protein
MTTLVLLTILAQTVAGRYREAVDRGVAFPPEAEVAAWTAKSAAHKRALGILLDRANWAAALAAVDVRSGLWTGGALDIRVVFREMGVPARGHGRDGRGEIAFDVERLAAYEKSIMEYERRTAGGAEVVVPPARTDLVLHHEVTHCFQDARQPAWLLEGAAAYVAEDPHFVLWFRRAKGRIGDVDGPHERRHLYARGWAFLEYVRAKHGDAAVRALLAATMREGKAVDEAAAAAAGRAWPALKAEEQGWSAAWVAAYGRR